MYTYGYYHYKVSTHIHYNIHTHITHKRSFTHNVYILIYYYLLYIHRRERVIATTYLSDARGLTSRHDIRTDTRERRMHTTTSSRDV